VCKVAAEVNQARERTEKERASLSAAAKRGNQARYVRLRWTLANGGWTRKELALLGTDDEAVAKRLGRSVKAVRVKRIRLKIPVYHDRRKR
jgi:hypothetical protein